MLTLCIAFRLSDYQVAGTKECRDRRSSCLGKEAVCQGLEMPLTTLDDRHRHVAYVRNLNSCNIKRIFLCQTRVFGYT